MSIARTTSKEPERSRKCSAALLAGVGIAVVVIGGCTSGDSAQVIEDVIANTASHYQVLDLTTGTITPEGSIDDLASNPVYRNDKMVFRLVPAGTAQLGTATGSTFPAEADEAATSQAINRFYLAVYEITQAQWQHLDETTPWSDVTVAEEIGDLTPAAERPAYGLSLSAVQRVLDAMRTKHDVVCDLPTDAQWEYACRAGSNGLYAWGDSRNASVAGRYAAVSETRRADSGPWTVGTGTPNGYGLYDLHGNIWEWTSDGQIRGGSWFDPVSLARAANKAQVAADQPHMLVGARLVYRP